MLSFQPLIQQFTDFLVDNAFSKAPEGLYAPIDYILQQSGKRLRPGLVLTGAQLYDEQFPARVHWAALAVEVFHNFTLVHDDIMDEAPIRRGLPTIHHKYGLPAGILCGDVMLIKAYECLQLASGDQQLPRLLHDFNRIAIEVCEGQQYDMDFETMDEVSLEQYLHMIELKTAALLGGSLRLGAQLMDAPQEDVAALDRFGRYLGVAFQIQDDYLDTFGEKAKVGKRIGGDIVQNKKTYLVLKAMEVAPPPVREELWQLLSTDTDDEVGKIARVTQLFRELEVPAATLDIKAQYEVRALAELDNIQLPDERKVPLKALADWLLVRER